MPAAQPNLEVVVAFALEDDPRRELDVGPDGPVTVAQDIAESVRQALVLYLPGFGLGTFEVSVRLPHSVP